jgi:hypothetical protein
VDAGRGKRGSPTTPPQQNNLKKYIRIDEKMEILAFGIRTCRNFPDVSTNLGVAIVRVKDFGTGLGRTCSKSCLLNETAVDRNRFCVIEAKRHGEQCKKGVYI